MFRKMIATFTAVAAALLVVGVAWASGTDDTSTSVTTGNSSSVTVDSTGTSLEDSTGTSLDDDRTTSTSLDDDGTTSTSLDGDGTTSTSLDDDHTTVTTIQSTTSTSSGSSTSTSFDDSDARRPADGLTTHNLPGVGSVTIEVRSGALVLIDVSAPGWSVELDKVEHDRIEVEFTSGDAEAEFDARIEGARVAVEIEIDSD